MQPRVKVYLAGWGAVGVRACLQQAIFGLWLRFEAESSWHSSKKRSVAQAQALNNLCFQDEWSCHLEGQQKSLDGSVHKTLQGIAHLM